MSKPIMRELIVIVEGQTEQAFVMKQLSADLVLHGITAWAVLPGRSRRRGGVREWKAAKDDIARALKERRGRYVTTMFDYYALPASWPGRSDSQELSRERKAAHVEAKLAPEIAAAMGDRFDSRYFIPYIQLHEFEALAFSDVEVLAATVAPLTDTNQTVLAGHFRQVLESAGGDPEAINDNYATCPSRRITDLVKSYRKPVFGPTITTRIGLDTLRKRCRHFASWLDRLKAIASN